MMPSIWPRDEDSATKTPSDPPSPSSYWFPLILVVLVCAGYVFWRRRQGHDRGTFGMGEYSGRAAGVRLSMDDDGPAATSFIMNNGSNESLPSHALSDLPTLPQSPSPAPSHPNPPYSLAVHPARQSQNTSPTPSYNPSPQMPSSGLPRPSGKSQGGDPLGAGTKVNKVVGGRRSARSRGPVEGADGESESESESEREDVFGIGDDDDEPLANLVKQ